MANNKSRNMNFRNRIKRLMKEEGSPLSTVQILEGLMNQRQKNLPTRTYKNTPTKQVLTQILLGSKEFVSCDKGTTQSSLGSGRYAYDVCLWKLVEEDSV